MFSRIWTAKSIGNYSEQLEKLKNELATADAIVIGAGAGLSLSAGFSYDGERFERHFSDFHKKYGFTDMYSGGFYPYNSPEEYWAWWSRHILLNRYEAGVGKSYADLLKLLKDKEYFVLTTNVITNSSFRVFRRIGCFTPRAITACGNALCPATIKPMTTKKQFAKWLPDKKI